MKRDEIHGKAPGTHETDHFITEADDTDELEYEFEKGVNQFLASLLKSIPNGEGRRASPEVEFDFMGDSSNFDAPEKGEIELFFRRISMGIKRVAKIAAPIAKKLAPTVAKSLVGMIPGVGAIADDPGSSLLPEAEAIAERVEKHFASLLITHTSLKVAEDAEAQEAALTELLAADGAMAPTESEAEALLAASLTITIALMDAQLPLRRVIPVLIKANVRLVKTLRRQGPSGRQLLRLIPAIQRRTIATLKKVAHQSGRPIHPALAVKVMATVSEYVLDNSKLVEEAIQRNLVMRLRTAPLLPRHLTIYAPDVVARRITWHAER